VRPLCLATLVVVSIETSWAQGGAPPPAAAPPAAAPSGENWTQHWDQIWPQRDNNKVLDELYNTVKAQQTKDPKDFEANVRFAALMVWQADGLADGTDAKASFGKRGWELAEKAVEIRPNDVRARYYAGTGIGLYSEGVGILTALRQGLEGKFRDHVQAALKLNKDFLDGAPQVLWGRYFFKLPWPKRDVAESIKVLRACVQDHPTDLRAKLYLADALLSEGQKSEAKKLVDEIAAAPLGTDPSEDRRIKARSAEWTKQHQKDLQ